MLEHPVSKGYYCDLQIGHETGLDDVSRIKQRMKEIVEANIPFHRFECHTTKVVELFCRKGMMDKVKLLETSGELYSYYYTLKIPLTTTMAACCPAPDISANST